MALVGGAPVWAQQVMIQLHGAGYKAYFVGGCVRDCLLGTTPVDWDVATNALPAQVQALFPQAVLVGAQFGTVIVPTPQPVEVTTFRRDLGYSDGRHPEAVVFAQSVEEDLWRRDFTINAMAWDSLSGTLIDPTGGKDDLAEKVIRAVGDPMQRFREDALRLLRGVRFACRLDFDMDPDTWAAAEGAAQMVDKLSRERVRDELMKTLDTPDPGRGLWMLQELGILQRIIPELRGSERLLQGKQGAPTLLDHLIQTAAACPTPAWLRLAGLLHDIGKLTTRSVTPEGRVTFFGHEEEGARLAELTLRRLRFDAKTMAQVLPLVRLHMGSGPITRKGLRRWLSTYGEEWVRQLLALRRADHVASGGRNAPWLDAAQAELETILQEEGALHLSDMQVNGHDLIRALDIPPGPIIGSLLNTLFDMVLANPNLNQKECLIAHARHLLGNQVVKQGQ